MRPPTARKNGARSSYAFTGVSEWHDPLNPHGLSSQGDLDYRYGLVYLEAEFADDNRNAPSPSRSLLSPLTLRSPMRSPVPKRGAFRGLTMR